MKGAADEEGIYFDELIIECTNLLFQIQEGAFDLEPVTVKPDNRQWIQCQAGACH